MARDPAPPAPPGMTVINKWSGPGETAAAQAEFATMIAGKPVTQRDLAKLNGELLPQGTADKMTMLTEQRAQEGRAVAAGRPVGQGR